MIIKGLRVINGILNGAENIARIGIHHAAGALRQYHVVAVAAGVVDIEGMAAYRDGIALSKYARHGVGAVVGDQGELVVQRRRISQRQGQGRIAQRHRAVHGELVVVGTSRRTVDLHIEHVACVQHHVAVEGYTAGAGARYEFDVFAGSVYTGGVGTRFDVYCVGAGRCADGIRDGLIGAARARG
ncbi:MAG: hypothetical protein EPGJADBJ_02708 [Saprospiraceae bacterium]|nr:hypothetical protein [Saprospiraceae bacterium]